MAYPRDNLMEPTPGFPAADLSHDTRILSGPNLFRNLLIMAMSMLTIMAGTTISPALPGIVAHFADTPDIAYLAQMVLTLPALAIAVTAPVIGMIVDRYGRRAALVGALVVYGLAGSGGLYLDRIEAILASRALLGIAVGAIMTATSTLVADYFSGEARNRFFGLRSTSISLGGIVFLVAGGFLAELGWRAPFGVYLMALVLAPPAVFLIREPKITSEPGTSQPPGSAIWREHLRHSPIYVAGLVHFLAFYFIFTQVPFRILELGITSTAVSGATLGTMTLFSAIFSMVFPAMRRRFTTSALMVFGFLPIALGFAVAAIAPTVPVLVLAMAIIGCGSGLLIPNLSGTVVSNATPSMRARVAGVMSASVFLGQFLSPSLTYPLAQRFGNLPTFGILAGAYVGLAGIALVVTLTKRDARAGLRQPQSGSS